MYKVVFKNINKIYPNKVQAVFDFNLEVNDKEFIVLVGPSGCGKSTTLRMLAGLESITSGDIYIDDVLVNEVEPKDRDIAMVFQSYALYPHLTVHDNMAFSLKLRKVFFPLYDENGNPILGNDVEKIADLEDELYELKRIKAPQEKIDEIVNEIKSEENKFDTPQYEYRHYTKEEIEERIKNAAEILGLEPYLNRKPKALSGGQRQRVALGRAIVRTPKVFLMDEPLSNLDAKLRVSMRSEIAKIHKSVGATTIYVTHDQTEAMTMATRIVVMNKGHIQQIGTPNEIYNYPANLFVADFIGSPSMNFIKGRLKEEKFVIDGPEDISYPINKELKEKLKAYENKEIIFGIRPEDVSVFLENQKDNKTQTYELKSDVCELLGHEVVVYGYINGQRIIAKTKASFAFTAGETYHCSFDESKIHFFDTETTERII